MPSTRAARTQESVFVPDEKALLELFPELAGKPYPRAGSYAAVPLLAYGAPQGVLSVGFGRRVRLRRRPARAAERARRAGGDRARPRAALRARAHGLADPAGVAAPAARCRSVPGLDLAGRLESGAQGIEVGGDFYDAFARRRRRLGDRDRRRLRQGRRRGRADRARPPYGARRGARAHDSPAAVLEALNRAVLTESRPGQFLTAAFARLTPGRERRLPAHARLRRAPAAGGRSTPRASSASSSARARCWA